MWKDWSKKWEDVEISLKSWALIISFAQFTIYLLLFIGVSYLSTLIDENELGNTTISKFQKYVVLVLSLLMIIPFALSLVLIHGLACDNFKLLVLWMKIAAGTSSVIYLTMFAAGIYVIVDGSGYIGYSLLGVSLFLTAFIVGSLYLIRKFVYLSVGELDDEIEVIGEETCDA